MGSTCSVPATLSLLLLTGVCAFPVYTAQSPGCFIWSVRCIACGSSFQVFHKSRDSVAPAFFAFPAQVAQAARRLTGALSPGVVHLLPPRGPSLFPPATVRCVRLVFSCDPRRMSTIQNLRKSLVRNWRPVCSVVGDAVSGAKFAPFPFPLPPASCLQQGWAGLPQASSSMVLLSPLVL